MTSTAALRVMVRDLARQPGDMREIDLSIDAPSDIRTPLIGVEQGSPIDIRLRLESVYEGILVSGSARTTLSGECGRCMKPITRALEVEFQELFAYSLEEEFDFHVEHDHIELEQVIRDAIILALPFQPVCREDCPGLCPICGARLEDEPNHTHDGAVDPRWAALDVFTKQSNDLAE